MSKHSKVTRYALIGTGARAFMFSDVLLKIYKRVWTISRCGLWTSLANKNQEDARGVLLLL
jgi:hypothetical protein